MSKTPQALELEAEKIMKGSFFLKPRQSDYEEASELFVAAANKYKINKQPVNSGKAYEKAAKALELGKFGYFEISKQLNEAAKVYKNISYEDYIRCQDKTIALEIEGTLIHQAAGHLNQAADSTLEHGDFDNAIAYYNRAGEFFSLDDSKSSVSQVNTQLAIIYSLHKNDYAKAAEKFEGLARGYLETNLTRFNAKECLFKAAICHILLKNNEVAREKVASYEQIDPGFSNSQEHKLVNAIIQSLEEIDEQGFTNAIAEYDSMHRLDPWKTQMLTKIKLLFQDDQKMTEIL